MEYNYTKKIADYYDGRITKSNDSISAAGQWVPRQYTSQMCEEICRKIGIKKGQKIFEAGCGSGVLGKRILKQGSFYYGCDVSFFMLKQFKKETNDNGLFLIQSTSNLLPFANDFFDIVILNGVTMYFQEQTLMKQVFLELERITSKKGIIFIGENIIPSRFYWELRWFQNLSPKKQFLVKPYIRFRRWLSSFHPKLGGKWKDFYADVPPSFVKEIFEEKGSISVSDAACYTIRKKYLGNNTKGNRRVDYLIKLGS